MWRTNVVLQILHFACGSVYGDTETLLFRMTRKGFVYGDKECLSERSEESGEEGRDNGPRTSQIRILLKDRLL